MDDYLEQQLDKLERAGRRRHLPPEREGVDFCSNDYLGMARSALLRQRTMQKLEHAGYASSGATGSRLISGNTALAEQVEQAIARYHGAEAGLLFPSGYMANIGLLGALPRRQDTILYDQYVHASLRDGIRLSLARSLSFRHNDLADLEKKLQKASGRAFIVIESLYSMDGDYAPLQEVITLADKYDAVIMLDEAHATGVTGPDGKGLAATRDNTSRIVARVHTFGKALGCHGAAVLGSHKLREYLINTARSFIYTTALPAHSLYAIRSAYELLPLFYRKITHIKLLIECLSANLSPTAKKQWIGTDTPIQPILVPGNKAVVQAAGRLQEAGFNVLPIRRPTVPAGKERLRICLHRFNRISEVEQLSKLLHTLPAN